VHPLLTSLPTYDDVIYFEATGNIRCDPKPLDRSSLIVKIFTQEPKEQDPVK
jgi:hypothetical protein